MSSFAEGFSSTFGPIFQAIQSGKKFELQDEELKYLKLQVEDYRGSQEYRDRQRRLELALSETKVRREKGLADLAELQQLGEKFSQTRAKIDAPLVTLANRERVRGAAAERKGTEQRNRYAAEDRDYAKKLQEQTLTQGDLASRKAESDLTTSQIGQTNAQLALAKSLGQSIEPGAADVMNIVNSLYEGEGIKDPGASARSAMYQVIAGEQAKTRREIEQYTTVLSAIKEDQALKTQKSQADLVQNIASQGAGYVAAVGQVFGENNPIYLAAKATVENGGLPTDRSNVDPLALEEGKSLIKQIGELNTEIRLKKQDLKNKQDDTYIFSSRKKAEGKPAAELADLEAQKAELEARRDQLSGGTKVQTKQTPKVSLSDVAARISATDSDERLKQIAEAYGLDFDELKKIRSSKKGK